MKTKKPDPSKVKPGDMIDMTHPTFPGDFRVRTIVREGETVKDAMQRAYMLYKVNCAFGDYRPGMGKVLCV